MKKLAIITTFCLAAALNIGCGAKESSFSLLSDSQTFQQSPGTFNSMVDILWVIDNSGSMATSQQNVTANFQSFIQSFQSTSLDFKMAVTTTDAYRVAYTNNHQCSQFRQGILNSSCNQINGQPYSGVRVMDMLTANLSQVFLTNIGTNNTVGSGDERAFQSIKAALNETLNAGFIRQNSFLSVVIVSDEDDFSHDSSSFLENYASPLLHTPQSYVDYLDQMTGSDPAARRYSVSAMAIWDQTCLNSLNTTFTGRKIGTRYAALIDSVNAGLPAEAAGSKASLCGNFAQALEQISSGILTLSSRFTLQRIPIPETIKVVVDGVTVPNRDLNPLNDGGWVFDAPSNSVLFTGNNYVPHAGAAISVTFDPVAYGQ